MAKAQHYDDSDEFFELFDSSTFDEERTEGSVWQGIVFDEDGNKVVFAEFTYDAGNEGSGTGWYN